MSQHVLPPLPYATDALEPFYDKTTLEIHHGKHHKAYVEHLNEALEGHPNLQGVSVEELLKNLDAIPEAIQRKVINNGGGHFNHTLFWSVMGPQKGGAPKGKIGEAIKATFGDFESFKAKWKESAMNLCGSGWTFLVKTKNGGVEIQNYADQECPLSKRLKPLLLLDVWEHAYYLKFQNRRPEWIDTWWNVVNWDTANKLYTD
jgi:Fe-Mn family superoxide dismutase